MGAEGFQFGLVILGYASLQGMVVFLVLLFQKRGNIRANRLLALLVFLIALLAIQFVLIISGYYVKHPFVTFPLSTLRYALGPLFLFYVLIVLNKNYQLSWSHAFHFLPLILLTSYFTYVYMSQGASAAAVRVGMILESNNFRFSDLTYLFMVSNKLHPMVYAALSYSALLKYGRRSSEQRATAPLNPAWLKLLTFIFFLSQLVSMAVVVLFYFQGFYTYYLDILLVFLISLIVHFISISAILSPEQVFTVIPTAIKKIFYAQGGPDQEEIRLRLMSFVEKEKPYLNPELRLSDLAKGVGVSTHALSYILNNSFQQNFNDFVNTYRVEEMKARVKDPAFKSYTLLANALDVGFNSKSSFNRVFKKHTGFTPSSYFSESDNS